MSWMPLRHSLRPSAALLGAALVVAGVAGPARPASACMNAVAALNENVLTLVQAEDDLAHGKPGAAIQRTLQEFPDLKSAKDGDRLMTRAKRIAATAVVRMQGLLAVRGFEASTAAERRANLEWAVATLRVVDRKDKGRPVLQAELAEALSALPEHQQEALDILERLAALEVMPSPYAYRALARLRALAGDAAGQRAALIGAQRLSRPPPPDDPVAWGFEN